MGSLCAREVELLVETAERVSVEILKGYRRGERGSWRLPDVAYEGEVWAVLQLTVDASMATAGELRDLVEIRVTWRDLEGVARETSPESLVLPARPAGCAAGWPRWMNRAIPSPWMRPTTCAVSRRRARPSRGGGTRSKREAPIAHLLSHRGSTLVPRLQLA